MTTGAEEKLLLVRPYGARMETNAQTEVGVLVDLALLKVMRNGLRRRSGKAVLRWGKVETCADGSGRQHALRSKTDQVAERSVLYLGPAAVAALLAIRPQEASHRPGRQRLQPVGQPDFPEDQGGDEDSRPGRWLQCSLAWGRNGQGPDRHGSEFPELMAAGRWEMPTMPAQLHPHRPTGDPADGLARAADGVLSPVVQAWRPRFAQPVF